MDTPEKKEMLDDLDRYKALDAIVNQEGGKVLLATFRTIIAQDVENILSLFRGEEMALRCAVAKLQVDLSFFRVLIRAKENAKLTEEALEKLME